MFQEYFSNNNIYFFCLFHGCFMTKNELVSRIRSSESLKGVKITDDQIRCVLDGLTDTVTQCLVSGDKVELRGFGIFSTKVRKARKFIDFQTKKEITSVETRVPQFKASSVLSSAVKGE